MGESVTEGTVLEWHKAEGDRIEADETLVEISTDKVDAEVPAPVAGTVVKVHVAEGDTVQVGAVLAEIQPDGAGAPGTAKRRPTNGGHAGRDARRRALDETQTAPADGGPTARRRPARSSTSSRRPPASR